MTSTAAAGAGAGNGGHGGASAAFTAPAVHTIPQRVTPTATPAAAPAVGVPGTLPSTEVLAAAASKQQQAKATVLTSDYIKSAIRDVVGGTMGGFGLVAVGHPFDTMKVRLQTQPAHAPLYNGLIDCVQQTMRREGVRGFYSGVFSPLCGQMFLNATQFFSWGQSSAMVTRHTGRKPENFELEDFALAGLMTALACAVVESPIDFFKSQLQVQVFRQRAAAAAAAAAATGVAGAAAVGATAAAAAAATRTTAAVAGGAAAAAAGAVSSQPAFHTVPQAFKYVLKNYGIRGAYQGLSATILRNVPFRSLYFGAYATTRELLLEGDPTITRDKTPTWVQLVSGGMAGLTQWFVCYPLDVIKSTMQTDAIPRHERKYKGWLDTVRKLYATGGVRMFFRGWTPCMLRSFPANAVCYWLYEKTVHTLERKM